ncbi:MAG: putative beta-lysine N-acetyltransferase [Desulfurivibrionaceae bacterium]|nr:putative beta-lysine N-acetyltransferase [Desulfurivibrionaceae bacterium]
MMADQLTKIGRSAIQHGKDNDRVYLIKLADEDMPELLDRIEALAAENGYGKIFAKVPVRWMTLFAEAGYTSEALVPFFFGGREDCHFMTRYHDRSRSFEPEQGKIAAVIGLARQEAAAPQQPPAGTYEIRRCRPADCTAMAGLFEKVFESYPFPVHDPSYIDRTMAANVDYFGVWDRKGRLLALASAEQDRSENNVEMTDFVTVSSHRRQGLAQLLLEVMEEDMRKRGIAVAYTIARAKSIGINKTFANAGYIYGGTLINNTQICGRLESMNVWHKQLNHAA